MIFTAKIDIDLARITNKSPISAFYIFIMYTNRSQKHIFIFSKCLQNGLVYENSLDDTASKQTALTEEQHIFCSWFIFNFLCLEY